MNGPTKTLFCCSSAAHAGPARPGAGRRNRLRRGFRPGGGPEGAAGQLIPGTEDYYYYHCLHYQNTEQFDKVEELLPPGSSGTTRRRGCGRSRTGRRC